MIARAIDTELSVETRRKTVEQLLSQHVRKEFVLDALVERFVHNVDPNNMRHLAAEDQKLYWLITTETPLSLLHDSKERVQNDQAVSQQPNHDAVANDECSPPNFEGFTQRDLSLLIYLGQEFRNISISGYVDEDAATPIGLLMEQFHYTEEEWLLFGIRLKNFDYVRQFSFRGQPTMAPTPLCADHVSMFQARLENVQLDEPPKIANTKVGVGAANQGADENKKTLLSWLSSLFK